MAYPAKDNTSPSTSSVFLPLGRRARRDSKSSLSNAVDREALSDALDTIHTAASQSQVLTVFNEYTDPPPSTYNTEGRGLAGDLQGGLSGLYNKFKASVGGGKDTGDHLPKSPDFRPKLDHHDFERPTSRPSSGLTSRIQSPRVSAFDSPQGTEDASQSSNLSAKFPVTTNTSTPMIPGLRSPTNLPHKVTSRIADPTVLEVHVNATNKATTRSRTGSGYDAPAPTSDAEPKGLQTLDGGTQYHSSNDTNFIGRGTSEIHQDSSAARSFSSLENPKTQGRVLHERGLSDLSTLSDTRAATRSPTSDKQSLGPGEIAIVRTATRKQGVASPPTETTPDALGSVDDDALILGRISTKMAPSPSQSSPLLVRSPQLERPLAQVQVSQSRLPGFSPSRGSSDSASTKAVAPSHIRFRDSLDGAAEKIGTRPAAKAPLSKLRTRLLSREFWMRDENARDCFHCGEPFSTFRRKHHCRTCGQIFDSKCTVLVTGAHFGSVGSIRVCKPCEAIIAAQEDDSSDYSIEDLALPDPAHRPRTPIAYQNLKGTLQDDDGASVYSLSLEQMSKTPTMSFPLRRAADSHHKSSAVLEFDTVDRPLARPSSSRSLKASHSVSHGHKRHHSRHQHIRNFKAYHEDRAPFQKGMPEDGDKDLKRSAFHRDSVIDPDLAQYLSDDPSSGDEQALQMSLGQDKLSRSIPENEKATIGGLLAAVRKGRSRIGERSIAGLLSIGRDGDDASVASSRTPIVQRNARKRNLSISSSVHQRLTPRTTRESLHLAQPSEHEAPRPVSPSPSIAPRGSRLMRSASMSGMGAPSMELNRASLNHVHKLLQQLLRDANVSHLTSWQNALVPILLKATDDVDPDVQGGDDIDIRNYVKLKKVSGGRPGDTTYLSGLIFTKNVALKSMARRMVSPRILIITFALEYARYEQHFMSLDPVIRQEREYLENLIGRIAALKPDLLLAQRNISGLALELLDKANITTAFNVKSTVLEAVSRCTQSRIINSVDKLTIQPGQLGTCEIFEVKTYVAEGRKRTYIYLTGCPPQLGCTIALRGADRRTLSKIKRITEFMVYVVYNLKLETCLMRDEWALIPNVPTEALTMAPAEKRPTASQLESSLVTEETQRLDRKALEHADQLRHPAADVSNAEVIQSAHETPPTAVRRLNSEGSEEIPDDVPVPSFYEDLVDKHQTKILSSSPFVKFMQPYLLMRARELERRVVYLRRLRDQDVSVEQSPEEKVKAQKFTLIQPEMVHASLAGAGKKVREVIHAVHDTEYDKALHNYETQKKQWEAYLSGNRNLFDPYAHQNIVVLFSQVSTATSVPCSGPDLLAFSFYTEHETQQEFEADCTLGQYVEDICYRANDVCSSSTCGKPMLEHHRQYVHGEAQISVFIQPYPAKMRGMHDTILMWSQCKVCGVETPVTPMSISTWKYSFGKYLETSLWSAGLRARAGICPHDLHRDHLRYFGYRNLALRIHYDAIDLLEIIVPRMRITWKVDNDLKFRNEVYSRIESRLTRFMVSVKLRLKSINVDALLPENAEPCRAEIERLTKHASEEHMTLVRYLQERYSNSKHWETIPLNRAIRVTMEKVSEWDNLFAEFEKNFFPSEKDIRRLATLQLKKIFLDRDVSVTSLTSTEEGIRSPPSEETIDEKAQIINIDRTERPRRSTILSPEKTQSVLQSVVEEHSTLPNFKDDTESQVTATSPVKRASAFDFPEVPRSTDAVEHLDLAVPSVVYHSEPTPFIQPTISPSLLAAQATSAKPHVGDRSNAQDLPSLQLTPAPALSQKEPDSDEQLELSQSLDLSAPPARNREVNFRRNGDVGTPPKMVRAQSQPATTSSMSRERSLGNSSTVDAINETNGFGAHVVKSPSHNIAVQNETNAKIGEKKLSDRLGLAHLKNSKFVKSQSLIPRAINSRKESRVSSLAKHFEQLSREFEKERIRERRQRAAKNRQSQIYPLVSSKPIVEVYKDVDEAVEEKDASSDNIFDSQEKPDVKQAGETAETAPGMAKTDPEQTTGEGFHVEETPAEASEADADAHDTSRAASDAEKEDDHSDNEPLPDEIHLPESPEELLRLTQDDLDLKESLKHERTSLMKMLTNFWAERSSSGWTPLEYPLGPSEHVFADCDVIVREDEPSSIIAFALDSQDYKSMLWNIQEHSGYVDDSAVNDMASAEAGQADVMHSLLRKTGTHLKYSFQQGPAKMLCKVFFAEQFDAVRRKCGVSERIVESLSRCMKWDSKGGKTKSLFLKTLDDRFVLKSLSTIETQSFLKFAPNYFQIMSEAFFHELPSVIAKMLGFYQIIIKNPVTGVEYNWFLLVMENLFYDRTPTRIFDLKGSMRNRKIQSTGERNEVLLDENMVEFIYESPLFSREHSKKLLRSSVHNDTLFLARQNVMDYSLMVAIDENRKELVVGIIDCIRTYTWDKKLESWIKDRGFAGGNKNRPTVTSPREYKKRFREAMGRYVLEAPNCWHQFKPVNAERKILPLDPSLEAKEGDKGEVEVEVLS